jgi:hypothetical protein
VLLVTSALYEPLLTEAIKTGKTRIEDPGLSTWECPPMGDRLVDFPTSGTMGGVLTSTMFRYFLNIIMHAAE